MSGDYVIKSGDNLSVIARCNNTTVNEILKLNPELKNNPNKIFIGQKLRLPNTKGMGTTVEHVEVPSDSKSAEGRKAAYESQVKLIELLKSQFVPPSLVKSDSAPTAKLLADEMEVKGVPIEGGRKFGKNFGSLQYWNKLIDNVSSKFGIPKELLIAKVSREVTFQKEVVSGNQYGSMQVRNTAVRSMYPGAPGNWYDKYKELDEDLLNDILYKKDDKGNYIQNSKGEKILKYSSWKQLLSACKDDEVSLKVGALYDKMQYAEYVTAQKYGSKKVYSNISKTIKELKENAVSPEENMKNIKGMETRYNGSSQYGEAIVDSLKRMGYNSAIQIIKQA